MTVLSGTLIGNPKSLEKKEKPDSQSILSLFEAPGIRTASLSAGERFKTFGQHFKFKKQANFAPIVNKFEPDKTVKQLRRWFAWRARYARTSLENFWGGVQYKRLQKKLALPKSFGKKPKELVVQETRAGQPIKAKSIKGAFLSRKEVFAKHKREEKRKIQEIEKEMFGTVLVDTRRMVLSFAGLAVLIILPMAALSISQNLTSARIQVVGATNIALEQLQEAKLDVARLQFPQAAKEFEEAGQAFQAIAAIIEEQYGLAAKIASFLPIIGKKIDAANSVLSAGQDLTQAAVSISQGLDVLTNSDHFLASQELSYKIEYLFVRLQEAAPYIRSANAELQALDLSQLPEDFQPQAALIKGILPGLVKSFDQVDLLSDAVLPFIGHDIAQRYLIIFQNNTELRATGGFLGSLALVDVDLGKITNVEIPGGGPYDYNGSLLEYYAAPRAIRLINARWELQDSNWFFDWPTSARKISNFYEKAGGPSVDGVIAIDTQVLQALLELVGPVTLEEYDVKLSAQNFAAVLQEEVEFNYDEELNQPKKIIADLAPILLETIKNLNPEDYLTLAQAMSVLLESRDILIYHNRPEVQTTFSELGWSGEVVQSESDYLAIVHTNLGGGKTDGVIDDVIDISIHIDEKGNKTNTLTIRRTHRGVKGAPLTGVRNVDYLRVYVPLGSQLIEASGFESPPAHLFKEPEVDWLIDEDLAKSEQTFTIHAASGTEIYTESNKTVFANWVMLDPQEVSEVKFVYKTPDLVQMFSVPTKDPSWADWFSGDTAGTDRKLYFYDLYLPKQSGSWAPELNVTLNFPQSWQVKSTSKLYSESGAGNWNAKASMAGDSYWSWLLY